MAAQGLSAHPGDDFGKADAAAADEHGHESPGIKVEAARDGEDRRRHEKVEISPGGQPAAEAGIQQAEAERQHAAHEIVAIAVERFAFGIEEQLDDEANGHQQGRHFPRTAVEQQPIDGIELQHEPEKPVRAGPDDLVGTGQQIVEHAQHGHDVEEGVVVWAAGDVVCHRESDETDNHHLEKFQIVPADEGDGGRLSAAGCRLLVDAILHFQAVGAEEEEDGDAVVAEERQQMEGQLLVGRRENMQQPVCIMLEILILVLLDNGVEPVAIVVKEYAQDGHSTENVALCSTEQRLIAV